MGRAPENSLLFPMILEANLFLSHHFRRMILVLLEEFIPFENSVGAEFPLLCQYIYPCQIVV